jgi:hypothetical protein
LSSSQLNVLAVSAFLALNPGVETLPLNAVALDDPLQSLDDVNLLSLIDLPRAGLRDVGRSSSRPTTRASDTYLPESSDPSLPTNGPG